MKDIASEEVTITLEQMKEKYQEFIRFYKTNSLMKRITIILKNKFSLRNSTIILIIKMLIRPIK